MGAAMFLANGGEHIRFKYRTFEGVEDVYKRQTIHRKGCFTTDDVGPAFIRVFKPGQILYGSRTVSYTHLKYVVYIFRKICVQKPQNGSKKKVLFPAIYSLSLIHILFLSSF